MLQTDIPMVVITDQQPNVAMAYIASLPSEQSRRTMLNALNIIAYKLGASDAFSCKWEQLRFDHMSALQAWLLQNRKPSTTRKYLAAVRGCLKAAWRLGLLPVDEYLRATDLHVVKGSTKIGKYATTDEVTKLLRTCRTGPPIRGTRDEAILRVLFTLGLRVAEVVHLQLSDFDFMTGELSFLGKGRKRRSVFIVGGTRAALDEWLKIRGDHAGALFETITTGDVIRHHGLKGTITVWEMLNLRCKQAGIRHFAPHDARRTAASNLLNQTDGLTTAKLLGHSSTSVTMLYDLRGDEGKRQACAAVGLPYQERVI